jgi:DNA-binding transcriptional MocR family regulator
MTPDEEAEFITLWNRGFETAEIARQLGIPPGTVRSRAHVLQQRGLIQPRPRGGPHARRVAQARQAWAPTPVQRPVQSLDTGAVYSADIGADHCTAPLSPG